MSRQQAASGSTLHGFVVGNRELLVERTRAGLVAAKKLGRVGGRKRRMTDSKIQSGKTLLISGVSPKEVARNLGVSIPTLYRWLPASERS
jgi:DNA invertase Pin-like site-specific DNA recombinase